VLPPGAARPAGLPLPPPPPPPPSFLPLPLPPPPAFLPALLVGASPPPPLAGCAGAWAATWQDSMSREAGSCRRLHLDCLLDAVQPQRRECLGQPAGAVRCASQLTDAAAADHQRPQRPHAQLQDSIKLCTNLWVVESTANHAGRSRQRRSRCGQRSGGDTDVGRDAAAMTSRCDLRRAHVELPGVAECHGLDRSSRGMQNFEQQNKLGCALQLSIY